MPFCGPHPNPHGARGLSKHYHLHFDQKMVTAYVKFSAYHVHVLHVQKIIDQTLIFDIPSEKQAHYQPVTKFTY